MAKQPHRDDDKAKKPTQVAAKAPAPKTPKPAVPNMSLDEPEEELFEVVEVLEEEAFPSGAAAPASDVEPLVLTDEDAPAEGVPAPQVKPQSDVFLAEPAPQDAEPFDVFEVEETPEEAEPIAAPALEFPAEEVVLAEDVVEVTGSSAVLAESDAVAEEAPVEAAPAAPVSDIEFVQLLEDEPVAPAAEAPRAPEVPVEPIQSEVEEAEHFEMVEVLEEEAMPIAEAAPAEELVAAEELVKEIAEVTPDEEPVAAEEPVEESAEAGPAEELVAAEEEIAEAAPDSDIVAAEEPVEEVAEAAPASELVAADEVVEEATESAAAVAAEEVHAEASSASEVKSGEVVEEAIEAAEEVSSATRKADAVLDDEAVAADPASGMEDAEAVEAADFDKTIGIDKVAEALESGAASAGDDVGKTPPSVEFDELLDDTGVSDQGKMAPAPSKQAKDDDDSTEMADEVIEENFDTAKAPIAAQKDAKKGKKAKKSKAAAMATGDDIDLDDLFSAEAADTKVSEEEALEAVEAEEVEAADAEETDEAEAAEVLDEDEVAEAADAEEAEEAVDEAEEAVDEAEEAVDEAEEAVDEAEEATGADDLADFEDDEKPVKAKAKKGKTRHKKDEEDEDEDVGARKKKGKKERATIATPQAQPSLAARWLGGMVVATILLAGGLGAGWYFAPKQIKELADLSPNKEEVPPPPPVIVKSKVEKAREAMDQGKYPDAIAQLQGASEPAELSARGEATWLNYYKQQTDKNAPLDKDAAAVKEALVDLNKGDNKLLAKQITNQFDAAVKEKELADQFAKLTTDKTDIEKQLTAAQADKEKIAKLVDSVADVLVAAKYIEDKTKFDVATLQKIMKDLGDDRATLAKVNDILEKQVKGKGEVGLMEVLKLKQQADDYRDAVTKVLEKAETKDKDAKGVQEIVTARNDLQKEVKGLDDILKQALKPLVDGKIMPENADPRKDIVAGTKRAREKAESPLSIPLSQLGLSLGGIGSGASKLVEETFSMAKTISALEWYKTREEFIQTPQEKLNTHITLLQDRSRNDPKALKAINLEADWVLSPAAKSDEESRGKAGYVKGLILRNEQKFAEATIAFEETLKMVEPLEKAGPWKDLVARSHKELTDPTFYYIPRLEQFQAEGNLPTALAEVNIALKAMPTDARLFVRRGLIRYEFVRGKGAKVPEEAQKEIRADAAEAAKDEKLAAESSYLLGLLEEELGKLDVAEKQYRDAIKLHAAQKGVDDEAGKYRVALGRLLLRERPEAAPAAPPANDDKKKKDDKGAALFHSSPQARYARLRDAAAEHTIVLHPWSLLAVSAVIAQQPFEEFEDKETIARLKDVMDEAEKLKLSKNPKLQGQGFCLMGSALSKLGKRTEGLKEFAKGLQLLYPGIETKEINELIEVHPAFQQPDSANTPNPIMAERHFGEGMHLFWRAVGNSKAATAEQDFKDAETQFRQAVKYYDKDARYQYYLGLTQFQQYQLDVSKLQKKASKLKRDSAFDCFNRGAVLEAKAMQTNPYATREINQSLERIQGELRQLLNYYRYRPSTEPETKKEVE